MLKLLVLTSMLVASSTIQAEEGVILLHGLCRSKSSMQKMKASLEAAGFIVENVGYPSRTASIQKLGDEAIGGALASSKLANCDKIHFVTHSLGGILVRSYFKQHGCERIGRVVMLGPPNQGSEVVDRLGRWWAFRKLNGPAGAELSTRSESTPNTLGPVEFELGIIAGDRSINWINSCMIQGKDDGKVSVERTKVQGMKEHLVVHSAHPFMMANQTVIKLTIRFLKTGTFATPPSPPM